jgi:hypothetical protein
MDEAIFKGWQIFGKIKSGDISSFNLSDIIWLLGIGVIIFLIAKISFKFMKVILVIAAVALLAGFLVTSGAIPIG